MLALVHRFILSVVPLLVPLRVPLLVPLVVPLLVPLLVLSGLLFDGILSMQAAP